MIDPVLQITILYPLHGRALVLEGGAEVMPSPEPSFFLPANSSTLNAPGNAVLLTMLTQIEIALGLDPIYTPTVMR